MEKFNLKFGWTTDDMEEMPCPASDGWKVGREKVWSANAKRNASATFSGTLIAEKVTLDMAFPANLTFLQIKKLKKYACPNPKTKSHRYCYIQFTNEEGETETKKFYFGAVTFDAHAFINGKFIWSSIQIQAVEV